MAKSRSIGGIYAELSLRDGKFKAGLKASSMAMKRFAAQSSKYAAAGLAAGAGAAAAGLATGTLHTLDQVDALGDLSAQTGVAVADLMVLQRAYKDGGRAAEMTGKDIGKMQKTLADAAGGGNDPFAEMGLSARALMGLNPSQQFRDIGAAIMRIQNPAERTAKAMQIFGKGGMGLTSVFPGIDAAAKALGKMPELAEKFAEQMGKANDLIGHFPVKSDQFFTGFTAGIVGGILPDLEKVDNFDFTDLGKNLGDAVASGLSVLRDGSFLDVLSLEFDRKAFDIFGKIAGLGKFAVDMVGAAAEARGRTLLTSVFSGSEAGEKAFDRIMAEKMAGFNDIKNPFQGEIDNIDQQIGVIYNKAAPRKTAQDPFKLQGMLRAMQGAAVVPNADFMSQAMARPNPAPMLTAGSVAGTDMKEQTELLRTLVGYMKEAKKGGTLRW
ncbi:MAG: hypothetical protein ABIS50_13970 [Luteolibacter sp.]|uniref:hypothetical protein n=1 Tax=Luteolibacter sp. TaxID=1962973 RepID=UPI003265FC4D